MTTSFFAPPVPVAPFPGDDPFTLEDATLARRTEEWRKAYPIETSEQEWYFSQYVATTVRIERTQREETQLIRHLARRATLCWDGDGQAEAERVGEGLARNPARTVARLKQGKHGCEWLIARWRGLAEAASHGGPWTDAQRDLAVTLLGKPLEVDGQRPSRQPADPAAFALGKVEDLERLKAQFLDPLDRRDREAAESGEGIESSPLLRSVRRREATLLRWLNLSRSRLLECHAPAPPGPGPGPDGHDEPEPSETAAAREAALDEQCMKSLIEYLPTAPPSFRAALAPRPAEPEPKPSRPMNRRARRAAERRRQNG